MASMDIRRHSHRSKSFSLLGSISDDSTITADIPSTPLRYLGIPFSWEQFPGIPKKKTHKKNDSSQNLLPPPPSGNAIHPTPPMKKYSSSQRFKHDPFFAAFVECSKDREFEIGRFNKNSKFPTGERSGFAVSVYSSCKRTCDVSESIVYRRRSPAGYY